MNERGALTGYRVLDLTDEKGVFGSRLLADMGAEVIRVERPGTSPASSLFFWANNLGKRSITLDIEAGEGQDIFKKLAATADVVIESHTPGYLASIGIGYADLGKINPRLIMASITDFGQDGLYRDYCSCGLVASALGGQAYVCGAPEGPPLKPAGESAYCSAGLFAAIGILLALLSRHNSGVGQYLDISVHECTAAALDHVLVRYLYEGVVAGRRGSLYWNGAFRVFPCRDGYVLLSLFQHWPTMVEWLAAEGMAEDLADEKWLDREYRLRHLDHVVEVIERWTQQHTMVELVEKGQLMHFPWAPVVSVSELVASPQLKERDFWVAVAHPGTGEKVKFPGAGARLSRSPWRVGGRVPRLGSDNNEIYQKELGLTSQDVEGLAAKGVI
ncbi:MAG TPA: CoA transferase [Dehalococcoidia bacterium]|nr:CoA transferase [Dehalococcoidia bacterium]